MNIFKRYIAFTLLLCPLIVFGATNDNEIVLDQAGDTLKLYIDQIGYGNKICGTIASNTCATPWTLTGNTVTMDIDMIGNLNQVFGPTLFDTTDVDLKLTGNSNIWDWNVGYGGSADSSVLDVDITGSSNTFDIDWGYAASAERLDFDLDIQGGSNVWNIDINSDDATLNVDVIGSSNNFLTAQSDGSDHEITLEWIGSNGDIDIIQSSGTCGGSISNCCGAIEAEFDSEYAIVDIKHNDTGD